MVLWPLWIELDGRLCVRMHPPQTWLLRKEQTQFFNKDVWTPSYNGYALVWVRRT